jgi:predicted alpha/beta hydrolase family esterase
MKKRVIIIHGWQADPEGEWLPWIKKELEVRGFDVVVPEMPDTNFPKEKKWVETIYKAVGDPNKNTYFIGHSLGCIAIIRYLLTLKNNEIIGGALFVAGFSGNISIPELKEFYSFTDDVRDAREHLMKCTMIYSDNDELISVEKTNEFSKLLGDTEKILVKGRGHFSEDEGVFELPEALGAVLKMSGSEK